MTLYALRPDPMTGSLDDAEVVNQSKYGWQYLEQAITLWQLVDAARAKEIEAVRDRAALAAVDDEVRFYAPDLRELVRLLAGIEDALVAAGVVDGNWRVPAEKLEDLARVVPAMDLQTERTLHNKTSALGEVISNAIFLRTFLEEAMTSGSVVVLG